MPAQSGQLQLNLMSAGAGNKPVCGLQIRSITGWDNFPCSSSTIESMEPARSWPMVFHLAGATSATFTSTSYRLEPMTLAATEPPAPICKSITAPLRT